MPKQSGNQRKKSLTKSAFKATQKPKPRYVSKAHQQEREEMAMENKLGKKQKGID